MNEKTRKPLPGLVIRKEVSKDARSLTYYLRKGVQWKDGGGELTAEDIKYTYEKRIMRKDGIFDEKTQRK